jgi:hypothetical protein
VGYGHDGPEKNMFCNDETLAILIAGGTAFHELRAEMLSPRMAWPTKNRLHMHPEVAWQHPEPS